MPHAYHSWLSGRVGWSIEEGNVISARLPRKQLEAGRDSSLGPEVGLMKVFIAQNGRTLDVDVQPSTGCELKPSDFF